MYTHACETDTHFIFQGVHTAYVRSSSLLQNVCKMNNKREAGRPGFCFAIDRGGTFTDIYAKTPSGKEVVMKLLSEDPKTYPDAPREGIRRIMEEVSDGIQSG